VGHRISNEEIYASSVKFKVLVGRLRRILLMLEVISDLFVGILPGLLFRRKYKGIFVPLADLRR